MNTREHLEAQLKRHEGYSSDPYLDTTGNWTIGYGHNLSAAGISRQAANVMFLDDIEIAEQVAQRLPAWESCNKARRNVLVNMAFNMGCRS